MNRLLRDLPWMLLALWGAAPAQQSGRADDGKVVAILVTAVEGCYRSDALLRRTCARIGRLPPQVNGRVCELPQETLESRTARDLASFKSTWRAELDANAAEIERSRADLRATHERAYAKLIAGNAGFAFFDLEALKREVDDCGNRVARIVGPRRPGWPAR